MRPAGAEKPIKLHVTIQNQVSHATALGYQRAYIKAALGELFMHGCSLSCWSDEPRRVRGGEERPVSVTLLVGVKFSQHAVQLCR